MQSHQGGKQPLKFKNEQKTKKHQSYESFTDELDEEEANFVRKLKKEFRKCKGKLPFKCFNYGKIGYYANTCPYP